MTTRGMTSDLSCLVDPASIAIIGASADVNRIGGMVLDNAIRNGFEGEVFPINPSRPEVQGRKAFPRLQAVPQDVDLAVIAVPMQHVHQAIKDCSEKGVKAVVVLSSGFGETGENDGRTTEQAILEEARVHGIRMLGPNCAGLANFRSKMVASFHPAFRHLGRQDGRIALVSQSGAFGGLAHYEACQRGVAFSSIVTTGNEADVQIDEVITHMVSDPEVSVILAYVESIRDGASFAEALRMAKEARKPIVMVKVGDSEAGIRAAASHTGALAAGPSLTRGLLVQHGVNRANSIEELFSLGYAFDRSPIPDSPNVLIVTASGGIGVLLSDDAAERNLVVPELSSETKAAIKKLVPNAGVNNPVDLTGQIFNDPDLTSKAINTLMGDRRFGSIVIQTGVTAALPGFSERLAKLAADLRAHAPKMPIHFVGYYDDELRRRLEAAGAACFIEPTHATRAIAALYHTGQAFDRHRTESRSYAFPGLPTLPGRPTEADGLALVSAAGIKVVPFATASGHQAAVRVAEEIGFPVALKVHSPEITHKSDVGGVRLGLTSGADVLSAAREMTEKLESSGFADSSSFIISRMVKGIGETIIGFQRDDVLGDVVMFGLGGIYAEALRDVVFRVGKIDRAEAHRMIREVKSYPLLLPQRGRPGADLETLADAIARFSALGESLDDDVTSVEVNPLLLMPDGVMALDALVTRRISG